MFGIRNLPLTLVVLTLATCVGLLTGCKQAEEPATPPPSRPKPAAKTKSLTETEVVALAKARYQAAKKKIPPYDKDAGLREIAMELYKVDLATIFPDGKYDLTKLKDEKEVTAILEDRAAQAISKDFSDARLKEMQEDVLNRFPYYKVDDVITVSIKRPDGASFEKKGKLMVVAPNGITIDGTRVLYQDLLKPDKFSFYKDQVERKRTTYIYNLYTLPKGEAKQKAKEELADSVYTEFGCTKKQEGWVSIKTLVEFEIQPELDKREKAYYKAEQKKLQVKIAEDLRNEGYPMPN